MGAFADYEQFDALGLADLVRRGKVAPTDLLEAAIQRVEARDGTVNAVIMRLYDHGRRAIADGLPDGPFRGVPFLLKDLGAPLTGERMTRGQRYGFIRFGSRVDVYLPVDARPRVAVGDVAVATETILAELP